MNSTTQAVELNAAEIPTLNENTNFSSIAVRPTSVSATGVSLQLLKDLTLKHVFDSSVISLHKLTEHLALAGSVVEELLHSLREEALIELSSVIQGDGTLAFRLTERGRFAARDAMERSGYIGAAPISLDHYKSITEHFSLAHHSVTKAAVNTLFSDLVIDENLLDQMGAAFNSRKAIFVYGAPGTGKTYTIGKMMQLYHDNCLIPHAIAIKDTIVQIYDPQVHKSKEAGSNKSLRYQQSYDERFLICQRPVVITGGELTADLLEIQYDARSKTYQAPLQLKANNGIFFIDDIGRQSIPPATIFNRWIVPMEENRDYLSLANGQHFETPFDVQLVFSSNLDPHSLADDAILRRIGFKINFTPIDSQAYTLIWQQELQRLGIDFDETIVNFVIEDLHQKNNTAMLPCHPRDLINMALTRATYRQQQRKLTEELLHWSWQSYFVRFDQGTNNGSGDIKTDKGFKS